VTKLAYLKASGLGEKVKREEERRKKEMIILSKLA